VRISVVQQLRCRQKTEEVLTSLEKITMLMFAFFLALSLTFVTGCQHKPAESPKPSEVPSPAPIDAPKPSGAPVPPPVEQKAQEKAAPTPAEKKAEPKPVKKSSGY
jgi:hypothetical protein